MAGVTSHFKDNCTLAVLLANNHNPNPPEMETSCNDTTDNSSEFEEETNEPYDLSMPKVMKSESPKSFNDQSESPRTCTQLQSKQRERNNAIQQNGVSDGEHQSVHSNAIKSNQPSLSANSMLQGMNEMRQRRILCDVLFCLEGEEFYAHKAVMASCSEYCREKFFTDNNLTQENVTVINLDLPRNGFTSLLDFVYTNTLTIDDQSVSDILQAAKTLKIYKLVEACNNYTMKKMSARQDDLKLSLAPRDANGPAHSQSTSPRDLCLKVESNPSTGGYLDKPRRASDSFAVMGELAHRAHLPLCETRNGGSSTKEIMPILHHSKSEGESSKADKFSVVGRRLNSTSDLLNDSATSGGLYQSIHWKKKQFRDRTSEQQKLYPHPKKTLSTDPYDEVFSEFKTAETVNDTKEHPKPTQSSSPTSLGHNATNKYFTYDFGPQQSQFQNMFPMPTYPDFTNINAFHSLFAYRFGTGSVFDNPLSYYRNSVQSHNLGQARTVRDIYPLLTPSREPDFSHRFYSSLKHNAADQAIPHKSQLENCVIPNNRTTNNAATTIGKSSLGEAKRRRKANSVDFHLSTTSGNDALRTYSSPSESKTSPINIADANTPETRQELNQTTKQFKKGETGKPYKCPLCDANFNRPANLKTHMRIHSGEKPYKCDNCGARFVQVAHLRAHVLIHTGEKPYPCSVCGTRFRHLQTLKSHLRIHTGEKPYSCEQCSVQFRHKSQLRLHLRTKHGIQTNTKKTYKQVPGLCSADICAHIKRAQEAVKTHGQTKFGTCAETANDPSFFADRKDSSNSEEDAATKCRSENVAASSTALNLNSLFKISVKGRLDTIPETGHLTNVPSLNLGQGVGLDLKVV
uniref:BCL6-like C2H2 Zinc finger n=1 Tax=Phallusia mammillata TaxID=59560 RepID=A0A6F9D6X7_9ASCI|nr:BCL6-like C2H2 Zinc finger [Phallusia mammillata]